MMKLVYAKDSEKKIQEIIEKETLLGHEFKKSLNKLCAHSSYVSEEYPKTYYQKGLIFEPLEKPIKYVPFDEWNLRLGPYLAGFEKFMFDDLESMLEKFPNSISAVSSVNAWRFTYGLILDKRYERDLEFCGEKTKQKALESINFVCGDLKNAKEKINQWVKENNGYNPAHSLLISNISKPELDTTEILFEEKPKIKPIALFGFEESILGLPVYKTALDYFLLNKL